MEDEDKYIKGTQEWHENLTSDDMQGDKVYTTESQEAKTDEPPTPTPDPTRKEQRVQKHEENKAARQQRREAGDTFGQHLKAEAKTFGAAIRDGVRADVAALKGKPKTDAAAANTDTTEENPAPQTEEVPVENANAATGQIGAVSPAPTSVAAEDVAGVGDNADKGATNYNYPAYGKSGEDVFSNDTQNAEAGGGMQTADAASNAEANPPTPPTDGSQTPPPLGDSPQDLQDKFPGTVTVAGENGKTNTGQQTKVTPLSQEEATKIWDEKMAPIRLKNMDDSELTAEQNGDGTRLTVDADAPADAASNAGSASEGAASTAGSTGGGGSVTSRTGTVTTTKGAEVNIPEPPTPPSAGEDPIVAAQEEYNKTIDDAYTREADPDNPDDHGGIIPYMQWLMKEREEYDKERTRREAEAAFWRSMGELGASMVNFFGVSGAFGGKNAYGRGAYSSMQKFDLTAGKMTEKLQADMEKRRDRMDEMRQKMMELNAKYEEAKAKGQLDLGKAKGSAEQTEFGNEYKIWKEKADFEKWKVQITETARQFDATQKLQRDIADKNNRTKIFLSNYEAANKPENQTVDWTFNIDGEEKTIRTRASSLYKVFEITTSTLADEITKTMGFANYERYTAVRDLLNSRISSDNDKGKKEMRKMEENYINGNLENCDVSVTIGSDGTLSYLYGEGLDNSAKEEVKKLAERYANLWNDHVSRLERYENARTEIDWNGTMTGSNKTFVVDWAMDVSRYYDNYGMFVYNLLRSQSDITPPVPPVQD